MTIKAATGMRAGGAILFGDTERIFDAPEIHG
jgi:hypothetical protein